MGVISWLKKWGVLLVAALALFASVAAICLDYVHYQEMKPHIQHEEIFNRLERLDSSIDRAEGCIQAWQSLSKDTGSMESDWSSANHLREQAESAWGEGDYTKADNSIDVANSFLKNIPRPPLKGSVDE